MSIQMRKEVWRTYTDPNEILDFMVQQRIFGYKLVQGRFARRTIYPVPSWVTSQGEYKGCVPLTPHFSSRWADFDLLRVQMDVLNLPLQSLIRVHCASMWQADFGGFKEIHQDPCMAMTYAALKAADPEHEDVKIPEVFELHIIRPVDFEKQTMYC